MKRQIGILGTTGRIIVGTWLLGSVVFGHFVRGPFRPLPWVIGLIVFPAIFIIWHSLRARRHPARFEATSPFATVLNVVIFFAFYFTFIYAPSNVARLDSLFKQREKLIAELEIRKLTGDEVERIMQYARNMREGITGANFDAKRRMLESLGVKVSIKDRPYSMRCLLGEVEGEIRNVDKRRKPNVNHTQIPMYLW